MSSIKDLLQEETDAEGVLKNAEQEADAIIREARSKAKELVRTAKTNDSLVKELNERHRERIAGLRAKIIEECKAKTDEAEKLYRRNLDAAVELIVEGVLGVEVDRRST